MNNSIFDVINGLRTAILPIGLPTYKEVKPTSQTGKCLVLTYVPIKKTNVSSTNSVIILLYLPKINGIADTASIETYCNQISTLLSNYVAPKGVVFFNELVEPDTTNLDSTYTLTTYKFKTINS